MQLLAHPLNTAAVLLMEGQGRAVHKSPRKRGEMGPIEVSEAQVWVAFWGKGGHEPIHMLLQLRG